jgi:hypothetical protein
MSCKDKIAQRLGLIDMHLVSLDAPQVIALAEDMTDPNQASSKAAAAEQAAAAVDSCTAAGGGGAATHLSALRIASLAAQGEVPY